MNATNKTDVSRKIAIDTEELKQMCTCGRATAVEIGTKAGARIQIGRRVLWNVEKIQLYLNYLSENTPKTD